MAMLDHLNDEEFWEKTNYLYDQLDSTLSRVLDEWVKEGIIKESDKIQALEEWADNRVDLFASLLG